MSKLSLERENRELRRSLRLMATKAERNDAIVKSFFEMELRLLSCTRLSELLDIILIEFKEYFRLDAVNLMLFDPEHAARSLLDDYVPPPPGNSLRFVDNQRLLSVMYPDKQLVVGDPHPEVKKAAFPGSHYILSCALLPLERHNCLIGSLHLGSTDPSRYSSHMLFDYVMHLASVISICIENCINYENMKRMSIIDMLTRVNNRRSFEVEIHREISRASRGEYPLSCLFLDLDYFKLVNDKYGHLAGDRVLRTVGNFLKQQQRKSDVVARYGGEEFSILLPNCNEQQAVQLAENLREKFNALIFRCDKGKPFRMTTSIGVSTCYPATYKRDLMERLAYSLISAADKAVYDSKAGGRDQVQFTATTDSVAPDNQGGGDNAGQKQEKDSPGARLKAV